MHYLDTQLTYSIHAITKALLKKPADLSSGLHTYISDTTESEVVEGITAVLAWLRNPALQSIAHATFASVLLEEVHTHYWNTEHAIQDRIVQQEVRAFCKAFGVKTPYVVIQSPVALTFAVKQEIALHLKSIYGLCFPVFQAEPSVLGGLRIFVDGTCIDNSWQKKIDDVFQSLSTYTH